MATNVSTVSGFLPPNKYNRDYYENGHETGASAIVYFCLYKSTGMLPDYPFFPKFHPIHWTVDSPPTISYFRHMKLYMDRVLETDDVPTISNTEWPDDFDLYTVTVVIQGIKRSYPKAITMPDGDIIFENGRFVQYCQIRAPNPNLALWNAMNNSKNSLVRKSQYAYTQCSSMASLIDTYQIANDIEYNVRVKAVYNGPNNTEWMTM